ncbi:F0F1 ATP synthase subunit A [Sodaliphilus sp.]|uniref:F0F1 ATP synthase subunit A n=1 Tax=Sodaliphilus sp. TaxID=2815818 RepID=UPI00388FA453
MKKVVSAIIALVIVGLMVLGYMGAAEHSRHEGGEAKAIDPKEVIFEHLGDAYGWELPFNHSTRLPLPIIVKGGDGWHCFMSSRVTGGETYEGFCLAKEGDNKGKVVQVAADGTETRPLDLSITKNAAGIFIAAFIVLCMVLSLAKWYRCNGLKAPRRTLGMLEFVIDFVYTDTIRPIMGKDAPKYASYLLTVFFFILTMNLLGLMVIFPGGANLTGNLAVTMVLALCTFAVITFTGNREYWKEIFWPDVPLGLKCPVPMMPLIEILGMFTKPVALMIRLFANMMGGHMVVLVLMLLIFIFTGLFGAVVGGATAVFSMLFTLFMLLLDTLVSFIQAYVFTMLSAIFISMAHPEHHHG